MELDAHIQFKRKISFMFTVILCDIHIRCHNEARLITKYKK